MNRPPGLFTSGLLRRPLLLALLLLVSALGVRAQDDGVTLNLKDADIRSLIETVAEVTGKNFVVDPRVKAKITVVSATPMSKDEVYQVFLSVLQVHGYAAVPVGEIVKIVPDITAKQGPAELTGGGVGDELITRVIPVTSVSAAQLVPILRPLVPQQGHLAAYTANNMLVISDRAANIDRIAEIVARMDHPISEEIEVIRLEHASASEIVRIVSAMQQKDSQLAGGQLPGQPLLVADDRTNSILLSGEAKARLRLRGLIAHLDTPLEAGGNTQVVFLNYANAEDLAPILLGVAEQQREQQQAGESQSAVATTTTTTGASSGDNEELDIQADERNNALIITAPPDEFASILSVIRQLDIRRAQVLVEAVIAEVSTTLANQLGMQFAVVPEDVSGGPVVASSLSGAGRTLSQIISNPLAFGNGLLLGAADAGDGGTRFALILQALASDTSTNILSTPTLVTLDNEEAEVVVAQNVPFITGQFTTAVDTGQVTGGISPFQTIERQDVGITLRITPQINEGDTIRLDIEQESSSVAVTDIQDATDLITNKRTIKTNVLVEDGQTLVLGGLIEDQVTDNQQKVPILGDIPLLGYLFRSDSTDKQKRSLMVFIHPVILRDRALATAYTNSKYDYLRARQFEAHQRRGLGKVSAARLPKLDALITQIPKSIRDNDRLMEIVPDVEGTSR
ncbi:MAG: type II secretion system secretin GspD [Gammaproteobacteria bacterium]